MGELLASQLTHAPLPLPESLLQALNPNRFVIRNCIRGSGKERLVSDSH